MEDMSLSKSPLSRQMAKELIDKAEEQLQTFRVQGLKLSSTRQLLDRTKKAYNDKKLNATIENLNELGSKINEIKKR